MRTLIGSALVLLMITGSANAQTLEVRRVEPDGQVIFAKRHTLAIRYKDNDDTSVSMVGTPLRSQTYGKAEIKRKQGRTRIKLKMENLGHPQSLGAYYTTYVLWAIAPEGQADNLAELPVRHDFEVDVTTSFQTFGLIVTAEPHSAVKLPSPIIVAENVLRKGTEGGIEASRIEYRGDPGTLYVISQDAPAFAADYNTPLLILGARRSVQIARRAGADRYAEAELREAEIKLAALEQVWPRRHKDEKKFDGLARDVMRLGERARELAVERIARAALEEERRAASETIARAEDQAARAREQTAAYQDAMRRAQSELDEARRRVDAAQTDAERARANEDLARAQAEQARLEAERARIERDDVQQSCSPRSPRY